MIFTQKQKKLYMKNFKFLIVAIIAISVGFTSCAKKENKTQTVDSKPNVKITQVFERNVPQVQTFTATIEPEIKNSIAPIQPGRISRILVRVGNFVNKGQKIVQMDAVNLSNTQVQIENLRRNYNRMKELQEVGGASQMDVDNIKAQLDQLEKSKDLLSENTYLTSPISGIVTAKNYDDGDLYSGQMPVLTIMQINPVKVIINVSESFYSQVKVGMPAEISVDVFPNERFNGKVSLIYPTIDEHTRTFQVEIKLQNNNNRVRPGMFARVTMNFGSASHVVVPDLAVVKQVGSGARFVYLYKDGKVSYNQVELGQRFDTEYELLSGVSSGSYVVVAGQAKLSDDAEVNVIK
ncbi:Cation efflux system protein [uncultured Paludibacter sp.]|nr:Cation efflux system protein [uncultured Paludibacter sp.]